MADSVANPENLLESAAQCAFLEFTRNGEQQQAKNAFQCVFCPVGHHDSAPTEPTEWNEPADSITVPSKKTHLAA